MGSAIGVGAAVSLSGMIGFIGLVVPHLVRLGVGVPHKIVVIGSAIAALLVMADLGTSDYPTSGGPSQYHYQRDWALLPLVDFEGAQPLSIEIENLSLQLGGEWSSGTEQWRWKNIASSGALWELDRIS